MATTIVNGPVIAAGELLSSPVDCTAGRVLRITTPAGWDPPENLSFQVSSDGLFFNDVYTVEGQEVVIPCQASRSIVLQLATGGLAEQLSGVHLKFRSGRAKSPVPQKAQREFAVAIET